MQPKKLAILLTEIHGYGAHTAQAAAKQEPLVRPLVGGYHGSLVKREGAAFICVFEQVSDAAACAVAIQFAVQGRNRGASLPEQKLAARILIACGAARVVRGDVSGSPVDEVLLVGEVAELREGGIALTETALAEVDATRFPAEEIGALPGGARLFRLPMERQKLEPPPSRPAELRDQDSAGRQRASDFGAGRKSSRRAWIPAAAALAVAAGIYASKSHPVDAPSSSEDEQTVAAFEKSGLQRNGSLTAEQFSGPIALFRAVDLDGNGRVTRAELKIWAQSHGLTLPEHPGARDTAAEPPAPQASPSGAPEAAPSGAPEAAPSGAPEAAAGAAPGAAAGAAP